MRQYSDPFSRTGDGAASSSHTGESGQGSGTQAGQQHVSPGQTQSGQAQRTTATH
jgi:hypothetical protein